MGQRKAEGVKRPAFQFYPKEWVWDLELRQCSIAARGLWADLLCLMHEGTPYGHLSAPEDLILRAVGISAEELRALTAELEAHEVFSRTEDGVIYSRRMVRDEARRNHGKTYGPMGGNPNLLPERVNPTERASGLTRVEEKRREDIRIKKEETDAQWGEFRQLYPAHRFDEERACRAWLSREGEADQILTGLRLWVSSEQWAEKGGRFANWASKFISEGIYLIPPPPVEQDAEAPSRYREWDGQS